MSDKVYKINEGFILRSIVGANGEEKFVVITVGEAYKKLNAMITLNATCVFIWKMLEKGATKNEIVLSLSKEYAVDETVVADDVDEVLKGFINIGVIND